MEVSETASDKEVKVLIKQLEKEMLNAVKKLEFEKAALLRDQIEFLKKGHNKKAFRKVQYSNQPHHVKKIWQEEELNFLFGYIIFCSF